MSWTWDAPSGVYKNHAMSSKLRMAAVADAQFMRFVRAENGFGKGKGSSITITRAFPLPLADRVSELDRLPSGRPALDTVSITPSEWGFKIPMTEFEKNLTHFDLTNTFQQILRDQMRLTMDGMVASAMKMTPYKFIPTTAGGVFDTDGVPSTTATANLSVAGLRTLYDELRSLLVPTFRNGKYIGILSTKAARGIKSDPEYKDWIAPTSSGPIMDGQLRDVEGFMLVESNNIGVLSSSLGTAGVLGEAIFFGADPAVLATVEEPELRTGLKYDLGRFQDIGWVGTLEAGLVWDQAAYARVIHVTSQ